ncbi:Ser-Thr-rich glycosyl-phosphatidyl-inositol-anchored membrane family-domain-containing protein [Aspergillus unguis]
MQLLSTLSLFLAFALSALAVTITSPGTTNQKVDFSKPFTIRWNTVSSDADKFTITLVNANGNNVKKDLAKDVDTSEGEYRVESVSGIPVGNNYQINFRSTARDNQGILAQSPMFNVTKVAEKEEDPEPTANATKTASEAAPSVTDNAAVGTAKGVFAGSVAAAGVMAMAVLTL